MPLRYKFVVLTSVFLLASSGLAQAKEEAAKPSTLQPVAWLVGGTWISDVKAPSGGAVTHVENRITWAPNHQAIEFLTRFNGQPHYNGFYAYNAATKTIGFYYTSSAGDLTVGTAVPDPDGVTLQQDFDITHQDGRVEHVRSTIVRDGDNAYWFTVFVLKESEWLPEFKIRYERK